MRRIALLLPCLLVAQSFGNLTPFKPTTEELRTLYQQSNQLGAKETRLLQNWNLTFTWIDNNAFFYRRNTAPETFRYTKFDAKSLQKSDLFDHTKLAKELEKVTESQPIDPDRLLIVISKVDKVQIYFAFRTQNYSWNTETSTLAKVTPPSPTPQSRQEQGRLSPNNKVRARIQDGKLQIAQEQPKLDWITVSDVTQSER
ncbi:MAG: hypothetical protein ACKVQS_09485, partial [Fimbriimonadaceae bacterium]